MAEKTIKEPFFIVGCVRSGTTLLRNMLALHPRLECPAETHLFHWAEAFGTPEYEKFYKKNQLFKRHRQEDGVTDFEFHYSLCKQQTRKSMMDWYGDHFLKVRKNPKGRWFEKTPQNFYGILLLSAAYPGAKFLHIVRNPLNVAASLKRGEVISSMDVRAASNYWLEAVMILTEYKKLAAERILEIKYENLLEDPVQQVASILDFIEESCSVFPFNRIQGVGSAKTRVRKRKLKDDYSKELSKTEIAEVIRITEPYFTAYGYRHSFD